MRKLWSVLALLLVAGTIVVGCSKESGEGETEAFTFVVYPGSRYLPDLNELFKKAQKSIKPNEDVPTAIYDTDASVEDVAKFYAKAYGYANVAPDATNNLSAAKPQAFYRNGDLQTDVKPIVPLLQKMGVSTDTSKAQRVWVKIMQRESLNNAAAMARFQREATGSKVLAVGKNEAGLPYVVATEFGVNALHGGPDSRSLPFPQNVDEVGHVIAWVIETRKLDVYTRPGSKPRVTEFLSTLGEDPPSSVLSGQWDAA